MWRKSSLGVALHRGHAHVMFLDNNTATASHKARTHGPGWRTAHASSTDKKGLIEGSLEVKLPTIWTDEKKSREEAERRERLEERRVE